MQQSSNGSAVKVSRSTVKTAGRRFRSTECSHETASYLLDGRQRRRSNASKPLVPQGSGRIISNGCTKNSPATPALIGRVTGQEFAKGKPYPVSTKETFPREPWFARRDARGYGVVLDAHGRIAWGRSDIGGDPIVVVLSEMVLDAHRARVCAARPCPTFCRKIPT